MPWALEGACSTGPELAKRMHLHLGDSGFQLQLPSAEQEKDEGLRRPLARPFGL